MDIFNVLPNGNIFIHGWKIVGYAVRKLKVEIATPDVPKNPREWFMKLMAFRDVLLLPGIS